MNSKPNQPFTSKIRICSIASFTPIQNQYTNPSTHLPPTPMYGPASPFPPDPIPTPPNIATWALHDTVASLFKFY